VPCLGSRCKWGFRVEGAESAQKILIPLTPPQPPDPPGLCCRHVWIYLLLTIRSIACFCSFVSSSDYTIMFVTFWDLAGGILWRSHEPGGVCR